jgi:hypothetical protein
VTTSGPSRPPSAGGGVDVLEVGRRGPSRRTSLLVVLPLVALLAAGVLVDQKARAAETNRLETCATRTHAAIHEATARMSGILGYVRPVWSDRVPRRVARSLEEMVSQAAVGTDRPLTRVRSSCAAVDVASLHAGLRQRRAACVQLLDTFTRFLRAVALDGSRATGEWPEDDELGC